MRLSYLKRPLFLLLLVYMAAILSAGRSLPARSLKNNDISFYAPLEKAEIAGVVEGYVRRRAAADFAVIKAATLNGSPVSGRLMARVSGKTALRWGGRVILAGRLKKPSGVSVPGNFDWKEYLADNGIYAELDAASAAETAPPGFVLRLASGVRDYMLSLFESRFPAAEAAIISGITIGEKTLGFKGISEHFRDSGAMHLLVASGSNVGLVTWFIYFLAMRLALGRISACVLAVLAAGLYTLCAGADPPVLRAYIMSVAATAGFFLERESGMFQGLVIAALIILAADPGVIFQVGFAMSFLSTFAIVIFFSNYSAPKNWPKPGAYLAAIIATSLCAQGALWPVFAVYFHKISLAAVLSNIVLIPLASLIMGGGFIAAFAGAALPGWVSGGVLLLLGLSASAMKYLVDFFAALPFASVQIARPGAGAIIGYYLLFFMVLYIPVRAELKKIWRPVCMAAVAVLAFAWLLPNADRIYIFSAGRSRSVVFKSAAGGAALVNAGISGDLLANSVLESGAAGLESVFLSSLDKESWSGLGRLAELMPVGAVYLPYGPAPAGLFAVLEKLRAGGVKVARLWPGQTAAGRGWRAESLWGERLDRTGRLWKLEGYSGPADRYSYLFEAERVEFLTGADCAFARFRPRAAAGAAPEFDIISRREYAQRAVFYKGKYHAAKI